MAPKLKTEQEIKDIINLINASPFYEHMGLKALSISEKGSVVALNVKKALINIYGITHGGAIASLADTTASLALAPTLSANEFAVTQNLSTNYLKPGKEGVLKAKGRILSRGKHSAILEVDVLNEDGETIAHAHTVHIIQHH